MENQTYPPCQKNTGHSGINKPQHYKEKASRIAAMPFYLHKRIIESIIYNYIERWQIHMDKAKRKAKSNTINIKSHMRCHCAARRSRS